MRAVRQRRGAGDQPALANSHGWRDREVTAAAAAADPAPQAGAATVLASISAICEGFHPTFSARERGLLSLLRTTCGGEIAVPLIPVPSHHPLDPAWIKRVCNLHQILRCGPSYDPVETNIPDCLRG
jgi:hypothetical protein